MTNDNLVLIKMDTNSFTILLIGVSYQAVHIFTTKFTRKLVLNTDRQQATSIIWLFLSFNLGLNWYNT